jgi:hypothetical protein
MTGAIRVVAIDPSRFFAPGARVTLAAEQASRPELSATVETSKGGVRAV